MSKKILFITFLSCLIAFSSYSQVTEQKTNKRLKVITTSYPDYTPFSYLEQHGNSSDLISIFSEPLNDVLSTNNIFTDYVSAKNYEENIEDLRSGEYDILMGLYNETQNGYKKFDHIEYLYPAVIQNPVSIITLNNTKNKITNINDLRTLRGVYLSNEYFSDYILDRFKYYGIKPVDDGINAYKKLFLGQVDYIIGSYYYHYVFSLQNGINNYLLFSKKPIWNMPMFIGISKKSKNYNRLKILLSKKITDPVFSQTIKEELKKHVKNFEQKSIGVVPPSFVLEQNENILTPADEILVKED